MFDPRPSAKLLICSLLVCGAAMAALVGVVAVVMQKAGDNHAAAFAHVRLPTPEERMHEPGMVDRGAAVFDKQCIGCHGHFLEGGEGPCLTDAVWLKGSSFGEVLKSIDEGSSEKGMPAFEQILSGDEKTGVIAFIKSRAQGLREVHYRLYEGKWSELPDFTALVPVEEGALKEGEPMSLAKFERSENYGVVFTGRLKVPVAGEYTFNMGSDDGSQWLVDGQVVVDNDGVHDNKQVKTNTVALIAGDHAFELRYFQGTRDQDLKLTWRGPASIGFLTEPVAAREQILVLREVRAVRGPVQGLPGAYHLMLGFPGGINCVVDLRQGAVPLAWRGDFLDVGGSRLDRGSSPNMPLGAKVVALASQPLVRLAQAPGTLPEYLGYRLDKTQVTLHWRLGGARFDQTLGVSNGGLRVVDTFVDPVPGALQITDHTGKSEAVPAAKAQTTTLELTF